MLNFDVTGAAAWTCAHETYTVTAENGDDLFIDPVGGKDPVLTATTFLVPCPQKATFEFTTEALLRSDFDSVVLLGWQDSMHWFKLCYERDPQGRNRVVSVVTSGYSDDANGPYVGSHPITLQCRRQGGLISLHYREADTQPYEMLRCFRIPLESEELKVGFAVQCPLGSQLTAQINHISLSESVDADIRGFGSVIADDE